MPPKKKRAVCPANQAALERLIVRRIAVTSGNDRVSSMVWDRAIASLAAAPTEITTHAQALALPYIGHAMATHLLGRRPTPADIEAAQPKKKAAKRALSQSSPGSSTTENAAAVAPRRKGQKLPNKRPVQVASNKEVQYEKAVAASENWKSLASTADGRRQPLTWRVVLLIDCRERKSEHVQAKCQMSGIPCEERQLPIGDMAWIAQGLLSDHQDGVAHSDGSSTGASIHNRRIVVELMLGTIIERKTPEDLKSSIFGTRYMEQRLRLQHCGLPQVLYLIEGDMNKPVFSCTFDTLHTAVWETRLHLGFGIVHTAHMAETVTTLKRMHRRILQRTFPRAFNASEALPIYSEGTMSLEERRRSMEEEGRRRRRRRQSLAEMTFDMDPIPPLGMERFISYQELKAKVELDRQAGTRTIGNIHMAMLKQVPGFDVKKCTSVVEHYPTMQPLLHAFATAPTQTKTQVSLMATQSKAVGNRTIGTKSAEHLRMAYSKYGRGTETASTIGDDTYVDGKPAAVDALTASVMEVIASATTSSSILQPSSATNVAPNNKEGTTTGRSTLAATEASQKLPAKTSYGNRTEPDNFGQNDCEPSATLHSSPAWMDNDMTGFSADDATPILPPPRKKPMKTSIGSFLRSSDEESPFIPRRQQQDTHTSTVYLDFSDDESRFPNERSKAKLNEPAGTQDDAIEID